MDAHKIQNSSNQGDADLSKTIPEQAPYIRPLAKGMGEAVARRTVYRPSDEDNWGNVAKRVALGNTSLVENGKVDYEALRDYIASGAILLSGRHLQHGDVDQSSRNLEVYSNCSTSATSFLLFYLLLNGSGVGRDYSDAMMNVNWDNAPDLLQVCSSAHPNFDKTVFVDAAVAQKQVNESEQKYVWFTVPDSREGWAQAAELFETMAFEQAADTLLVLDWSEVRESGKPIGGMQDRPASGPVPSAYAFKGISALKGKGLPLWQQAMFVDHYLAECVVVGGARRSARMSTKYWKDKDILDYISIKKHHGLWSSNNSIIADAEFYEQLQVEGSFAQTVMKGLTEAAYFDGTGEPGIINVHNFAPDKFDWALFEDGKFADSFKYHLEEKTTSYMKAVVESAKTMPYTHITNPCVTADTWIQTDNGPRQVSELIGQPFNALVGNKSYKATGFFQTGVKPVFKIETQRGYMLRLTDNHKVLIETSRKKNLKGKFVIKHEWVEVKDLKPGNKLVIDNHRGTNWEGPGSFEEGWILGQIVGDGGYNKEARLEMVAFDELAAKYLTPIEKQFLPSLEKTSFKFYQGFLRGMFDADGTVAFSAEKGRSVRLAQADLGRLEAAQRMLSRMGIASTIYKNRRSDRPKLLPDGKGGLKMYLTRAYHELVISRDNIITFAELVGFNEPHKIQKLKQCVETLNIKRKVYRDQFTSRVTEITPDGIEAVYDCTVDEVHQFDANGLVVHNCGEISLNILGGYCVIADVVPYFAKDIADAEQAFRITTRALIRANTMRSLYDREVKRTNRIGVGFTGLHEFAFKQFGYGFQDLIDEQKSKDFWLTMARFSRAVKDEAKRYSKELGVNVPVTDTTVKPAGTTSKLFGVTEGAHLPSMREYLRWVQYRTDSQADEIAALQEAGYPVRQLTSYKNTTIVGFPTQPVICRLGMGDKLVTASEATPEEQYQYLMLLEKYWIRGTDEQGNLLEKDTGNQISYCLAGDGNHLIPTSSGLQRIENIQPASVPDRHGAPQQIVDLVDNGVKTVRKARLINGIEIIGTPQHRLLTVANDLGFVWKTLGELQPNDIVVRRVGDQLWSSKNVEIPEPETTRIDGRNGNMHHIQTPKTASPKLGLFLGMLMSDGSISTNGVSFVSQELEISQQFLNLAKTLFGLSGTLSTDSRAKSLHVATVNSRILARWLTKELGISRYHDNNRIPKCVLESTVEVVKSFIRGYTLDGYVASGKNIVAICTTVSKTMSKDLLTVLYNLGYDAALQSKAGRPYFFSETNKGFGKDQYQVVIPPAQAARFVADIGFMENRKNKIVLTFTQVSRRALSGHKANALPAACLAFLVAKYPNKLKGNEKLRSVLKAKSLLVTVGVIKQHFESELETQHLLNDSNFRFTPVESVEDLSDPTHTYDITVDVSHEYVANSVVVHNTLKYDPSKVDYNHFVEMIVKYQSKVRCCSVMPFVDTTAYEYQPEEPFGTVGRFFQVVSQIKDSANLEDIDMEHLRCSGGACPL